MQKETSETEAIGLSCEVLEFLKFKYRDRSEEDKETVLHYLEFKLNQWNKEQIKPAYAHHSRLIAHAEREFSLLPKEENKLDQTYQQWLQEAALELLFVFSKQGHSGGTAPDLLALFNRLVQHQPLTPITNNPAEWTDMAAVAGYPLWQNDRDSTLFSKDGGQTYSSLDAAEKTELFTSEPYNHAVQTKEG